ncbi:sigma-70 family RNA polymerase sigma factor [Enterococcus sp. AZ109]|uniref:sigma-70 family RNA polymerase sigma factor n=1 Tax=Enterococcus sp. AZ109 TaxID=2774634 RepID=UPI003F20700D
MSKVEKKREKKINEAIASNNWDQALNLLDQPFENDLRKDRHYNTVSMNNQISSCGEQKEYINNIAEPNLDPLEHLIIQEDAQQLKNALSILSKLEKQIILGYYWDNKPYSRLAKELAVSDKTVKKRLESSLQKMKDILREK